MKALCNRGDAAAPILRAHRRPSLLGLLSLLALSGSCREEAPPPLGEGDQGWALVVGISQYQDFPGLPNGAENARRMAHLFETTWQVPAARTRVLLDGDATLEGIREVLVEWLPSRVGSEDFVVIFLSGYGSLVPDGSGDEKDGLDEGFCPVDALADDPTRDLLDDTIALWIAQLPTDRVTLIVDSDHAGHGDQEPDHLGPGEAPGPFGAAAATRCGG